MTCSHKTAAPERTSQLGSPVPTAEMAVPDEMIPFASHAKPKEQEAIEKNRDINTDKFDILPMGDNIETGEARKGTAMSERQNKHG